MTIDVVEKIKQAFMRGSLSPQLGLADLKDIEERVLKILSSYPIIEKQKLEELADLLKKRPKDIAHPHSAWERWFKIYEKKFVEGFSDLGVKDEMKRICGWCGEFKKVYTYEERDYEEVKDLDKNALLIEKSSEPLRDDDVVGVPICKECHDELYGVDPCDTKKET